jgi:membrane protease YdiL (CAAX protease family)
MIYNDLQEKKFEHWGSLGTLLWGSAIFLFVQNCSVILTVMTKGFDFSESAISSVVKNLEKDGALLSIYVTSALIFGCIAIYAVIKFKKNSNLIDYLAINKISYQLTLRWIGLVIGYLILTESIRLLLGESMITQFMSNIYKSASPIWMLWIAIILAAPIFEEVFFRGFLFKGLIASPLGTIGTIVLTSALWAAIHSQYGYIDLSIVFFLGILFGYARFKSNSILLPIAMHSFVNLLATIQAAIW